MERVRERVRVREREKMSHQRHEREKPIFRMNEKHEVQGHVTVEREVVWN